MKTEQEIKAKIATMEANLETKIEARRRTGKPYVGVTERPYIEALKWVVE